MGSRRALRERRRALMVIEAPQGPQITTAGHIAKTWPGLYAEAWKTGNRRLYPLQQLGKEINTVEDYDSMREAMDWLALGMPLLLPLQYSPQSFGWGFQSQLDIFEELFQSINHALASGQLSDMMLCISSVLEIFEWIVKLIERDGGYSPPSLHIYRDVVDIVTETVPLLINYMPNGVAMAFDLLRTLHRVFGKDTGELATIILSMGSPEITSLYQTANLLAQTTGDILALKIVQLLSFQIYPPQIQWMVDQY